jgi:hypothetical protein
MVVSAVALDVRFAHSFDDSTSVDQHASVRRQSSRVMKASLESHKKTKKVIGETGKSQISKSIFAGTDGGANWNSSPELVESWTMDDMDDLKRPLFHKFQFNGPGFPWFHKSKQNRSVIGSTFAVR